MRREGRLGVLFLLLLAIIRLPPAFADDAYWEKQEEYYRFLKDQRHQYETEQELKKMMKEREERFCAIAYSESTDLWGYSFEKDSLQEAEQVALKGCGAKDAKILCWSKGNWYCALADGPNSYGAHAGETQEIAKAEAMKIANSHGPGAKIVLVVGGRPTVVWKDGDSANNSNSKPANPAPIPANQSAKPVKIENALMDFFKSGGPGHRH